MIRRIGLIVLALSLFVAPARAGLPEKRVGIIGVWASGNPVALEWVWARSQRHLVVLDASAGTLSRFDGEGRLTGVFGSFGTGPGELAFPEGFAADEKGRIYVADTGNDRIQVFAHDGTFLGTIGGPGSAPGRFRDPRSVTVSRNLGVSDGVLVVADTGNDRIQILDLDGRFLEELALPAPIALHCTTFGGLIVASAGLRSLRSLSSFTSNGRHQLEPVPAMAVVRSDDPGRLLADAAEDDEHIYVVDRSRPELLVFSERWSLESRVVLPTEAPRSVEIGTRRERPTLLVADGRHVLEVGFDVDSPLPVFQTMREALERGDVDGALEHIHPLQRPLFRQIFEAVREDLPDEASRMTNVRVDYLRENEAILRIETTRLVGGKPRVESFPVHCARMPDGSWKIVDY